MLLVILVVLAALLLWCYRASYRAGFNDGRCEGYGAGWVDGHQIAYNEAIAVPMPRDVNGRFAKRT